VKKISLILCLFFVFLGPLVIRARIDGTEALEEGRRQLAAGQIEIAADSFRISCSWNNILNSNAKLACLTLEELLKDQTLVSHHSLIRQELYRALMSSRGLFDASSRARANELKAQLIQEAEDASGKPLVSRTVPFKVHYGFQLLAQLMFWLWLVGIGLSIRYGCTSQGKLLPAKFLKRFVPSVVFFIFWLLCLSYA
jgi:hypothetical protein